MEESKRLVVDVDGVIAQKGDGPYAKKTADPEMLSRLRKYKEDGFYIILYTARNMRTHGGRIGKINAETAPVLVDWLDENDIPYDEIYYGKPWCGYEGFYVDDKAIRPSEFLSMDWQEILDMLEREGR
ncbi:hypothetical protein [Salinibacter ruber]|uniref:hypothetical protein n=1 Tax=Salinibacter ruber TaxID=146919 RepID=UPI002073A764|nr:hypothetical protein [Salinibacter ruber]